MGNTVSRDVDDDEGAVQVMQHPAAALEVEADLLDALSHRHVHSRARPLAKHSVIGEANARLKAAHCGGECRIVARRGVVPLPNEVTSRLEAALQHRHACVSDADAKGRPRGH